MTSKSSVKKNILMTVINTAVTLLFPLVTFPLMARRLSPDGIGRYDFIFSLTSYFILFALLGVPLYATKRIAALREKPEQLREEASSFFFFTLFSSILMYAGFLGFAAGTARDNLPLYAIIGFYIVISGFDIEWYFQAHEKFGFIALRNIIIKVICAILLLVLVQNPSQLMIYSCIMIGALLAHSLANVIIFIRRVKPSLKLFRIKPHFKAIAATFLIYVASKINSNLDVVMLGYMKGDFAVGQYAVATKVVNLIVDITFVINTVMLPRVSSLLAEGDREGALKLIAKAFKALFLIALACSVGLIFISYETVDLMSGKEYLEGVVTMRVLCPNILLLAMMNFFGVQVLYAFHHEKLMLIAIVSGAVLNAALNFVLIQAHSYFGAAIATLISNCVIVLLQFLMTQKLCKFDLWNRDNLKTLLACVIMVAVLLPVYFAVFPLIERSILRFVTMILIGMTVFTVAIFSMKHTVLIELATGLWVKLRGIGKKKATERDE